MNMLVIVVKLIRLSSVHIVCKMASMKEPKPKELRLQVIVTQDLLDMIDDLRRGRISFPTRSDIVRELIEKAHAEKVGKKVKRPPSKDTSVEPS
jgi:hypothetical protein